MRAKAANRFYEANKKYIADKIAVLDLALVAMEDAIGEAYGQEALAGTCFSLNDFRKRQAQMIFEEAMSMGSSRIEEITRS